MKRLLIFILLVFLNGCFAKYYIQQKSTKSYSETKRVSEVIEGKKFSSNVEFCNVTVDTFVILDDSEISVVYSNQKIAVKECDKSNDLKLTELQKAEEYIKFHKKHIAKE